MLDAIVIGLGAMGSAALCQLARRGQKVAGFEQFGLAHDQGSSHGASRIIRMAYYEDPAYVPLLRRSYELWRQLERDTGEPLLHLTGGLMLGPAGSAPVRGSLASAREHGLDHEVMDAAETGRRYPPLHLAAEEIALLDPEAGYLNPEACLGALARQASGSGAELHWQEPVEAWEVDEPNGCVVVRTGRGRYEAGRLLLCGGAWMPKLLEPPGLPLTPTRQVMAWFAPAANAAAFAPDRFPIYIWQPEGELAFYGFPATGAASEGVKVARHAVPDPCTADSVDRQIRASDIEAIRTRIARRIPDLNGRLLAAKTCMYTMTPDAHAILGFHPRHERVLVAGGFSGHGFKFAPVIGKILADLALEGRTRHPIALFSPRRF
ncbi:MAG: N-methyl-L-tryptophan oxidase [Terriglobales bacterium]